MEEEGKKAKIPRETTRPSNDLENTSIIVEPLVTVEVYVLCRRSDQTEIQIANCVCFLTTSFAI